MIFWITWQKEYLPPCNKKHESVKLETVLELLPVFTYTLYALAEFGMIFTFCISFDSVDNGSIKMSRVDASLVSVCLPLNST